MDRAGLDKFDYRMYNEGVYSDQFIEGLLNEMGWELLKGLDITPNDVARALKDLLQIIAKPFAPHASTAVQEAQIHDLLMAAFDLAPTTKTNDAAATLAVLSQPV